MSRTMGEIAKRYDEAREKIIQGIRAGRFSASMSGIDYYPRPWAELDMANEHDAYVISTALTWDAEAKVHDYDGLRKRSEAEMAIHAELRELSYEAPSAAREAKRSALNGKLKTARL